MVRDDCVKRLDELEKAQPSIVFDVKDPKGADIIDVRVSVDGQPLADHLDGAALKVDPGVHTFTFEVAGQLPVQNKMLVREGEAGRHEVVVVGSAGSGPSPTPASPPAARVAAQAALAAPPPALPPAAPLPPGPPPPAVAPAPPPPAASSSSPSPGGLGTQQFVGLVAGGGGVAGLAAGSIFGVMSGSAWSSAKNACGGNASVCTNVQSGQSFRSTAESDATLSTVGFIVGGCWSRRARSYFSQGAARKTGRSASWSVRPSVRSTPESLSRACSGERDAKTAVPGRGGCGLCGAVRRVRVDRRDRRHHASTERGRRRGAGRRVEQRGRGRREWRR
jgi:hypothetical protein